MVVPVTANRFCSQQRHGEAIFRMVADSKSYLGGNKLGV